MGGHNSARIESHVMWIYSAGRTIKSIKGMRILECRKCGRETEQDLVEMTFAITAMNVPLIPVKKNYGLSCRKCGNLEKIEKERFDDLTHHREKGFFYDDGRDPLKEIDSKKQKNFCRNCGEKTGSSAQFCRGCGKRLK